MCVDVFTAAALAHCELKSACFVPAENLCVFIARLRVCLLSGPEGVESDDREAPRGGGSEAAALGGV